MHSVKNYCEEDLSQWNEKRQAYKLQYIHQVFLL